MRLLTSLFSLFAAATASHVDASALLFAQFMRDYDKSYDSMQEVAHRLSIFAENLALIEASGNPNLGVGPFADMTAEEFASTILLPSTAVPSKDKSRINTQVRAGDLPDSYDARDDNLVTEVKDQGTVGSCWAFSTAGAVEGAYARAGNKLTSMSPEYLVDCDGSMDEDQKHADCGVFGGWPYLAVQKLLDVGGIPTEEAYPYCSGTGDCFPCYAGSGAEYIDLCGPAPLYCNESRQLCPDAEPVGTFKDWGFAPEDEDDLAQHLLDYGPISVLLDATGLQHYKSGVWDGKGVFSKCSKTDLDHAVLLIGFGTDNGQDYWLLKNSWAQKWGEDGYFRMKRGEGLCGVNTNAVELYI